MVNSPLIKAGYLLGGSFVAGTLEVIQVDRSKFQEVVEIWSSFPSKSLMFFVWFYPQASIPMILYWCLDPWSHQKISTQFSGARRSISHESNFADELPKMNRSVVNGCFWSNYSTPNGGLVREITLFQGNLGWWNIIPFGQMFEDWVWHLKVWHCVCVRLCKKLTSTFCDDGPGKCGLLSICFSTTAWLWLFCQHWFWQISQISKW